MTAPILLDNPIHQRALDRAMADLRRHFPCVIIHVVDSAGKSFHQMNGPSDLAVERLNDIGFKRIYLACIDNRRAQAVQALVQPPPSAPTPPTNP